MGAGPSKTMGDAETRSGARIPKLQLDIHKGEIGTEWNARNRMSLQLHMDDYRARTDLSPAERHWRKQYLLGQRLHPDEPIAVEAVHRHLNPIRKIYRYPWDKFYAVFLEPKFGTYWATVIRAVAPKYIMGYIGMSAAYYYMKYNYSDWQHAIGPTFVPEKKYYSRAKAIDAEDPTLIPKSLEFETDIKQWTDRGGHFKNRGVMLDVGETKRPW